MQKWEYVELGYGEKGQGSKWTWGDTGSSLGVTARLNLMGQDGWELVSAYSTTHAGGYGNNYTANIYYLFKRPKD